MHPPRPRQHSLTATVAALRPLRPHHLGLAASAAGLLVLAWAVDGKDAAGTHRSASAPAEAVEASARSGPGELAMPYFSFGRRSGGGP